jgi:hypothetical protein
MFSQSTLFASLIWGAVGTGFFIYGKKQISMSRMIGGIAMIAISYFVASALAMSACEVAVIALTEVLARRE